MNLTMKKAFCSHCGKDLQAKVPADASGIVCFACDNQPIPRIPSIPFKAIARPKRQLSIPPRPGAKTGAFTMLPDPNDPNPASPPPDPKPPEEVVHRDPPADDEPADSDYEDEVEDEEDEIEDE
jgi:hypothetical protein